MAISPHVLFVSSDFPGVKKICYVRSVIATVPAVPAGGVSKTTWWDWYGCAPGVAGPATRAFLPGRPPSDMSRTCTAECAATWTCSAFRASTGWACWPGFIACFEFLRIAAPRAAIGFSHFGFTAASFPRSNPWSRSGAAVSSRPSLASFSPPEQQGDPKVDFHHTKRMITKGDGVRLITAVLLAGQMMTPDKFLVAESCPRR